MASPVRRHAPAKLQVTALQSAYWISAQVGGLQFGTRGRRRSGGGPCDFLTCSRPVPTPGSMASVQGALALSPPQ